MAIVITGTTKIRITGSSDQFYDMIVGENDFVKLTITEQREGYWNIKIEDISDTHFWSPSGSDDDRKVLAAFRRLQIAADDKQLYDDNLNHYLNEE